MAGPAGTARSRIGTLWRRSFVAKAVLGLADGPAALIDGWLSTDAPPAVRWERAASWFLARVRSRAPSPNLRGAGCRARAHEALIKQTAQGSPRRAHIARTRRRSRRARSRRENRALAEKSTEAQAWSAEKGRGDASEGAKRTGASGQHGRWAAMLADLPMGVCRRARSATPKATRPAGLAISCTSTPPTVTFRCRALLTSGVAA